VQSHRRKNYTRNAKFFWIGLSHESLSNYYKTNFTLMTEHGYSLTEVESMMPWEREIYIILLIEYIKEKNEKMEAQQAQQQG